MLFVYQVEQAEEERDVCAVCWEEVVYARGEGGIIACCQCKKEIHFTCAMKLRGKDCPSCREPMFPHAPGHEIHGDIWTAYLRQEADIVNVEANYAAQAAEIHTLQQVDFESKREIERLQRTLADQRATSENLIDVQRERIDTMKSREEQYIKERDSDKDLINVQRQQIDAMKSREERNIKERDSDKDLIHVQCKEINALNNQEKRIDTIKNTAANQQKSIDALKSTVDSQERQMHAQKTNRAREREIFEREVAAKETQFKLEMDVKNFEIFALRQKLDTLKIEDHTVDVRKRLMSAKNEEIRRLREQPRRSQSR